jgi:class 3 adenylate cyclase
MGTTMVERRLAAIMVLDVVAYSRLMGADEIGTLAAFNAHKMELLDPAVAAHHGRVVKHTGDGMLLEFASVVDAIGCAVAIQRGMLSRNERVPEEKRMVFRIGVNIGDIIIDGNDIFGDGVNVAARLESLCEPGGICISRAANEQVRDKLSLSFADLGEHMVKNIARAVGVFGLKATDIASLPEIPLGQLQLEAAAKADRRRPERTIALAASIAVLIGVAAGAAWWITRGATPPSPRGLERQLAAALAESLPGTSLKYREDTSAAFAALGRHRAIALARRAEGTFRTGDWPTREIAEEKVLEKCQQLFDEPCAVLGADDAIAPLGADGAPAIRDMPRVHYTGLFNPERIPGVRERERQRPEIAGYATAPGPKAIALHASGIVRAATGAPSQRAAEEQALRACNNDPARRDAPGPCYLYAAENKVVLPLRSTTPIAPVLPSPSSPSAPPSSAPPAPSPPAAPRAPVAIAAVPLAAPGPAAFLAALTDTMTKIAPSQPAAGREAQIAAYQTSSDHKAIAAFPPSSSWRASGQGNPRAAEERVLEGCEARYGEPCVLVAVDDAIEAPPPNGKWPRRAMPRAEYQGLFDPQQIPAATEALRLRPDVASYRAMQGVKAAAYHPWGRIFIAAGPMTQREAEERALAECNADPQRNGQAGSCFLYAVGDQVVLPKRSMSPMTGGPPAVK